MDVSDLFRQGESWASVTPYQQFINRKNKRKKTPDISVIIKEPIGDTVNSIKISKEDTVTIIKKEYSLKPPYVWHKVDYEGNNNENNRCSDDSRTETDDSVRKLDK